jgi:hypothetical protein
MTLRTLPDAHQLKWRKALNSVEEKRENLCKALDGKQLFSALYGMYTVTMNELKAFLSVSAKAG